MELMNNSKKFVESNIKKELDPKLMEMMQYVVMALLLTLGDVAKERLPKILAELNIYAEGKTVLEMAHEYLNNYQEDDALKFSDACVTRSLSFEDDGTFVEEKRNLIVSLKDGNDYFNIISKLIHEFIHLLRFGGVQQEGHTYKIKDGISVSYFDADKRKLRRKHENMEEGIVQRYTNLAIHNLYNLLQSEKMDSSIYQSFMTGYKHCKFQDYLLETSMIDTLCKNPKFQELVDQSFVEEEIPAQAIQYFNSVMNSSSAFLELGKLLSKIRTDILNDQFPVNDFAHANAMASNFLSKSRSYQ